MSRAIRLEVPGGRLTTERITSLLVAWTIIVFAMWIAVSFTTYMPVDSPLPPTGLSNLGGSVGRVVSQGFVEAFGVGSFGLPFFMVFAAWRIRTRSKVSDPLVKLLGVILLMLTLGILCEVILPNRALPRADTPVGGILGSWIASKLVPALGRWWSLVFVGIGFGGAIILATDRFLLEGLASWLGKVSPPKTQAARVRERTRAARALEDSTTALVERRIAEKAKTEDETELIEPRPRTSKPKQMAAPEQAPAADDVDDFMTTADKDDALPEKRGRRKKAAKPEPVEPDADEADATEDEDAAPPVAKGDADEDDDEAPAKKDPAAPAIEPVPPKMVRIRDSQPAKTDAKGVTVINLARDPKLKGKEKYDLPPLSLLVDPHHGKERESDEELQTKAQHLIQVLADFDVQAEVDEIERGPVITRYDLNLARGTKISRVTGLADDLGMGLGVGRVRIAQVKGKAALGVEIPNRFRETVFLKEIALAAATEKNAKMAIPLFLGKDSSGNPIIEDLATTPHLLIAGRTGAGKSVFVNSLVLSILLTRYPEEVRIIMIDPKRVELEVYQEIPHLLTRVESDPKKATLILEWAVTQMEERYALLSAAGVRTITAYNKLGKQTRKELLSRFYSEDEIDKLPDSMPYVVIIVDELADLMMSAGKEVEQAIARLAQKARAVGIHVVLATQRPSTDVITGLIKSNMPARIAFQTRTGIDSRTILDRQGAEKLLDKGDLLYLAATSDDPRRCQGPFVSDEEVNNVVAYLRENASTQYTQSVIQVGATTAAPSDADEQDELFEKAVEIVLDSKQASTSWIQRQLSVGYARAGRLIDLMAEAGYISGPRGSKPREILITSEQWKELKNRNPEASEAAEAQG
jgi:S-DNA-T family DNA segregation ATPase FtsK/SpoIIIE